MADESNAGGRFHHHHHHHHHHQNNNNSRSGELIPMMANYYGDGGGGGGGGGGGIQMFTTNNNNNNNNNNSSSSSSSTCSSSSAGLLLDSVPGLKHDTGLAVEWSVEEQYKLEQGLLKYANQPNIMHYIKIASSLHDKTVRDVALRCRWMARKRRKQDNQSSGKKVKDRKDKLESFLKNNMTMTSSVNMPSHSLTAIHHHQNDTLSGALSCKTRHLLEENSLAFGQISANISTLKLQENIDLFFRARNNIASILNDMQNMPGIISRMPPLPVFLNEELAGSIFPRSSQPMMFGTSSMVPLKQEPGC